MALVPRASLRRAVCCAVIQPNTCQMYTDLTPTFVVSPCHMLYLLCLVTHARTQTQDSPGVYHHIYYKQHSSKQDSELLPKKKTLFVLNPPLDTVNGLTAVFEEAGSVEAVRATVTEVQQKDHKPVKAAYVVFKKTSSATKALAFDDAKERVLPEPDAKEFGLKRKVVLSSFLGVVHAHARTHAHTHTRTQRPCLPSACDGSSSTRTRIP